MDATIVVLPGDGIGPEVTLEAVRVLQSIADQYRHNFKYQTHWIGGKAIDETGSPLPEETLRACLDANAVLLGAVGGPRWSDPSLPVRPEQGLLELRQQMGVFCNVRPVVIFPSLAHTSPLKENLLIGVDFIIVRELTGGLYFGKPRFREHLQDGDRAVDTLEYTEMEIERIAHMAFGFARNRKKKVTSVDKANVLETSRLWRQTVIEAGKSYPDVQLEHMLVDSAAMRIISSPSHFDVILTENMFGDILSDEASVLAGSLGLLPSASLGGGRGLYEPIHGSAPDIVGKNIANPVGAILSTAMLLRYSFHLETEAKIIEDAVSSIFLEGILPADLGGSCSTVEISDAILQSIRRAS